MVTSAVSWAKKSRPQGMVNPGGPTTVWVGDSGKNRSPRGSWKEKREVAPHLPDYRKPPLAWRAGWGPHRWR